MNFQLVRVDQNNIAYPTDCLCQTEPIHEFEGKHSHCSTLEIYISLLANGQQPIIKFHKVKKTNKKKKI